MMKPIICFGEVLWDVLPGGRKLGGAPLNVALRAQSLGHQVNMISSIGRDQTGEELAKEIKHHGGSLDHIQLSETYPTSEVLVKLDAEGTASYHIKMPCAWDSIVLLERDMEAVKASDAFIFGSLVARHAISRKTLVRLLELARYKVFDVNLRPPHYSMESILSLMQAADFVKFNEEELTEICHHLDYQNNSLEENIRFISGKTGAGQVCVTRGKDGAVLRHDERFYYNPGYHVIVADTVGAGDSFLASIISCLMNGWKPQEALDYACAVGSIVASKTGANPAVSESEIRDMMATMN